MRNAYFFLFALLFVVVSVKAQETAAPADSLRQAQELTDRSVELDKSGHYAEAVPLAERALAIREKVLGPAHPDTARSLDHLATLYCAIDAYPKAEPLYERALAIREKVLGPDHPDVAQTLNNLGLLYQYTHAYSKAEDLHQRALAIREKAFGAVHAGTAESLNNLAIVYYVTGVYSKAEPLYQRALAIREKVLGPDHPETALTLNILAGLYYSTGAFSKAEPLYQRALAIREKVLGPDHPDTAYSIRGLAELYRTVGAYSKAEPLYQRALAIRERALGPDHTDTAGSLSNLATIYTETGAYSKAEPLYQRTLTIREKVLGPEHPNTAGALNQLANLYTQTGAYSKAVPLYLRALTIREKVLGPEHPETAESLNDLAGLYSTAAAFSKAEPLYRRALAIREKMLGPDHPDTAYSLTGLADLYRTTAAYSQAEPLYQRAIAIYERAFGSMNSSVAGAIDKLAELYWVKGEPTKAVSLFKRAQIIQAKNTGLFLLSGSEERKQAYLQRLTERIHRNVSFSVSVSGRESVRLGLTGVLEYKGRIQDTMAGNLASFRRTAGTQDQKLFEQLTDIAAQLSVLAYQGSGGLSSDHIRQRLDELTDRQDALEAELSKRSAEFRKQIAPVTIATVTAAIPKDAVVVEWFRYTPFDFKPEATKAPSIDARYAAYVLKRGDDPVVVDVGEAQAIESLVREFREITSDPGRDIGRQNAVALSEKLLTPLRKHLKGYERILMAPDGALNLLPMAALFDEGGRYLAQNYEITYLTSVRDLLRFNEKASVSAVIVMADPDFGSSTRRIAQIESANSSQRSADLDRSGLIFRPLTNSALEAQALKNMMKLKDSDVFLQFNATESNLKQVHHPRILHIASHGFFLSNQELDAEMRKRTGRDTPVSIGENPLLRSGIALAGANVRRSGVNDDGIFTALEASKLDLHGTELVVLSACDTGIGDVLNGEGVYGLRRALVLAGAQTQVTSLWKVPDEATRTLMVDFYQRLLNGEGRSAALRHAQLRMLADPKLSHPYYWASFVPIGNWAPLSAQPIK